MRFSVWLVSGYAHVFVLLSVVIVPYPLHAGCYLLSMWKHLQYCRGSSISLVFTSICGRLQGSTPIGSLVVLSICIIIINEVLGVVC